MLKVVSLFNAWCLLKGYIYLNKPAASDPTVREVPSLEPGTLQKVRPEAAGLIKHV